MESSPQSSSESPSKTKDSMDWLTDPRKAGIAGTRDSVMSMLSGESYNPSEIGEAVQLEVVEEQKGHVGPVKQTFLETVPNNEGKIGHEASPDPEVAAGDEESVFSSSTVQLGRLDTIKSSTNPRTPPEISVNTAIDEVVPPRSKRRPVSEIVTPSAYPKPVKSPQRKRFSLNISDDLDRLMESASGLSDVSEVASSRGKVQQSVSNLTQGSVSKESFQTAEDFSSDGKSEPPLVLPQRPNAQNMSRARQVSASLAQQQIGNSDVESVESSASIKTWHDEPLRQDTISSARQDETPLLAQHGVHGSVSSRQSWTRSVASSIDDSRSKDLHAASKPEPSSNQNRSASQVPSITPPMSPSDQKFPHEPQYTKPSADAVILETVNEGNLVVGAIPVPVDDDGFYDIEEPVVVSHPARAKSVRDHTRLPSQKGNKRRNRRSRQHDAPGTTNNLKPFSYKTLVHLLESMNGAVIGQEFETLNLPIQEKQIIEKVIDSLSRLTSDMVMDKHRYEIGMERLEKAHRVLEGFL